MGVTEGCPDGCSKGVLMGAQWLPQRVSHLGALWVLMMGALWVLWVPCGCCGRPMGAEGALWVLCVPYGC